MWLRRDPRPRAPHAPVAVLEPAAVPEQALGAERDVVVPVAVVPDAVSVVRLTFTDGSELALHPRDPWAVALVALAHEVLDRRDRRIQD